MRSSVVLAVQGKGAAIRLYKRGACLSGLRREAEVFEEARPDAFCSRYCMWGMLGLTARQLPPGAPSVRRTARPTGALSEDDGSNEATHARM